VSNFLTALILAFFSAFRYSLAPWQKKRRNKEEKSWSASEPVKPNQKGFNAGDLAEEK